MMLGEAFHYLLTTVVVECSEPVSQWHSEQNRVLRDTASSEVWLVKQLQADFYKHVNEILACHGKVDLLDEVGLISLKNAAAITNDDMLHDQEIANVLGEFALALATRRVVRCLWFLRAWPCRMVGLLGNEAFATRTMTEFRLDLEAYRAMCALPDQTKPIKRVIGRSCFANAAVRQYTEVWVLAPSTWLSPGCVLRF
jgi:hypothetical protein